MRKPHLSVVRGGTHPVYHDIDVPRYTCLSVPVKTMVLPRFAQPLYNVLIMKIRVSECLLKEPSERGYSPSRCFLNKRVGYIPLCLKNCVASRRGASINN